MNIQLTLSLGDFQILMKGLNDKMNRLREIQKNSNNEDEVADAGNDLIAARMLWDELSAKADASWGKGGWTIESHYL
jgi:hypothetical protein